MADSMERIKLMITIVDRDKTARAAEMFAAAGVGADAMLHYAAPAMGTANSDLLDYLGLGETGKSFILSLVPQGMVPHLLRTAREMLQLSRPGKGILFTMPLSGVGRAVAQRLQQPTGTPVPEQEVFMQKGNGRLIVAVVASGHTDTVMAAAKSAGARGGTILHGRRLDFHEDGGERRIQPERDVVVILAPQELQRPIMEAVNRAAGLATECHGVIFSLPVDEVEGLPGFDRMNRP